MSKPKSKIGTFQIFEDSYKVEYTTWNDGHYLNDETEIEITSILPEPEEDDMKWVRATLEDKIRFHELEGSINERQFQKHFAEEMRSDESRGN
jgi:hypothetical protein